MCKIVLKEYAKVFQVKLQMIFYDRAHQIVKAFPLRFYGTRLAKKKYQAVITDFYHLLQDNLAL